MESNDVLKFEYEKGVQKVYPAHPMVNNWQFKDDEHDEALLCHHMAKLAEKSGMNANDMLHLFPAVLRMLRIKSTWGQ